MKNQYVPNISKHIWIMLMYSKNIYYCFPVFIIVFICNVLNKILPQLLAILVLIYKNLKLKYFSHKYDKNTIMSTVDNSVTFQ